MNYKSLIVIALALCLCLVLPVSAEHVWNNENFIDPGDLSGYTVVHDAKTGVDSKYKATSSDAGQIGDKLSGVIIVRVRAGYNTLTPQVGIRNDLDGEKGTFQFHDVGPDGICEIRELASGNYTLFIPKIFNEYGEDEFAPATVVGGQMQPTYVAMLGHAVSGEPAKVAAAPTQCVQKIKDVTCKVDSLIRWYDWKQYLHIDSDYDNLHYNALFGDPDVGTLKELRVVYKYEKWGWSRVLVIKSAQYGTFCGETKVPKGYTLKSVAENVDMDIHYSTPT